MSGLPAAGEVHLWRVALDEAPDSYRIRCDELPEDERQRCARLASEPLQRRYVQTRWALRRILADYLDCSPSMLRFAYSARGKPALAAPTAVDLQFSVSHSDELALLAFTVGAPIGVDLERVCSRAPWMRIARRHYLASELLLLYTCRPEDRLRCFFQIWTCKEAYVKAVGSGLGDEIHRVRSFLGTDGNIGARVRSGTRENSWQVQRVDLDDGYVAAVSVAQKPASAVRILRRSPAQAFA